MSGQMGLTDVLEHVDDTADGDKLKLGDVLDALGSRGFGPLLIAVALIELLPTGAIPGVPTLLAVIIVFVAVQLMLGWQSPWLPQKLRARGFGRDKFAKGRKKVEPVTKALDKAIKPRLQKFTTPLAARLVGALCLLLAFTMPPLELVPFASSIPSAAIALFGVGLTGHDGLIILLGLLIAVAGLGFGIYWLAF